LLAVSEVRWRWLAEIETEFDDWHPDDREAFVVDWPVEDERLEDIEAYYEAGVMTEEQAARYEELKKIVARNRLIIDRLADR
jgi:hypothetical protein